MCKNVRIYATSFQFYVSLGQAVGNTDSPCFVLRKKDQTKRVDCQGEKILEQK